MKVSKADKLAKVFRALANKKRLQILRALAADITTINQISDYTSLPYKTVERHLKIMVGAGVAKEERIRQFTHFKLNNSVSGIVKEQLVTILDIAKSAR